MSYPAEVLHLQRTTDESFEYKIVVLTQSLYARVSKLHWKLTEEDMNKLGIQQTKGWEHYFSLPHERHILMCRRKHAKPQSRESSQPPD